MGIGLQYPTYGIPGVVTDRTAEQNQRGFYQRWGALMDARGWDDLARHGRQQGSKKGMARRPGPSADTSQSVQPRGHSCKAGE